VRAAAIAAGIVHERVLDQLRRSPLPVQAHVRRLEILPLQIPQGAAELAVADFIPAHDQPLEQRRQERSALRGPQRPEGSSKKHDGSKEDWQMTQTQSVPEILDALRALNGTARLDYARKTFDTFLVIPFEDCSSYKKGDFLELLTDGFNLGKLLR